jgi:biotin carboxylase
MSWNVFVIGYDDLGKELLPQLNHAQDYEFHSLLTMDQVYLAEEYHFDEMVAEARRTIEGFSGSVDAIVGYWDFPTSALLPVLRRDFALRGPSLEAVLKCEHKYWSRLEQSRAVPECVPNFQALDPFDDAAAESLTLDYPFWLKPVKAHSSHLGFLIENARQLEEALPIIRQRIGRFGRPMDEVCAYAEMPDEVARVSGHHCVAESIISAGRQCTLEGYVQNGEVHLTGLVDSQRDERHRSVLLRYEYPSSLSGEIQERMLDYCRRVMHQIGFDEAPFNIEFYHDEESERIWLLEVNSRLSRSHAALFQLVDGAPHFQVMVDVALGIAPPRMPRGEGRYAIAAKQMLRVFEDGIVRRVPSQEEIRRVKEEMPGTLVDIEIQEGTRLSELLHQDSFSFEIGVLYIGADSEEDLERRIERCQEILTFEIDPLP